MVISVDTGNKMIKTEHYEFNSGIDVLDTIPGENDEVIEFGGKYYRTTNRRISYMEDKTEDDRYYILTLIAIAKELDTMKKEAVLAPNELIEIELLVGLPPAHYGKYRKKFQQYFQRDGKVVGFKYGGTSYQILIHEVKVYVQAYAAYCVLAARRHLTELPKVLVILPVIHTLGHTKKVCVPWEPWLTAICVISGSKHTELWMQSGKMVI